MELSDKNKIQRPKMMLTPSSQLLHIFPRSDDYLSSSSSSLPHLSRNQSDLGSISYRGIRKPDPTRENTPSPTPATVRAVPTASSSSRHQQQQQQQPPPPPPSSQEDFPPKKRFSRIGKQHARSLSLQDSLSKPLPEPPPPGQLSPETPLTAIPILKIDQDNRKDTDTDTPSSDLDTYPSPNNTDRTKSPSQNNMATNHSPMYGNQQESFTSDGRYQPNLGRSRYDGEDSSNLSLAAKSNGAGPSPSISQNSRAQQPSSQQQQQQQQQQQPSSAATTNNGTNAAATSATGPSPSAHLSGLMCNVHRTTGREPPPLVGATTNVLGDKLYVFGGRILSRSRPAPLTSDLYELDLIRRHWTKLETTGDIPPPRYFHSVCPLGETKLVCYGGMSPTAPQADASNTSEQQPEVSVMSDIYIYDVTTNKWAHVSTLDAPQGRYAHCACILPSSSVFASHKAPLSALHNNPSAMNPNEGRIGVNIDGTGGAEMIVVGGQDGANHYIEQISVFNLRSLRWTSIQALGKSCGAYRSVVAPLPPAVSAKLGRPATNGFMRSEGGISIEAREPGSSMLIYSNYNFLDVKLELQVRSPDGTLIEKTMSGAHLPPGLRFPNGGIIDTHFVVSGTYLTSSKQEYALWALDLRNLTWSRIDAGGNVFSQGSWNRGVLWNRRNTFVILGNRKRSLVDDYNHRRINFTNVCMVELEAFGFYDNPRRTTPMAGFVSASSPFAGPGLSIAKKAGSTAGGRFTSRASEELGEKLLTMRELSDMDILCIGGERIPVNSRIVARRWGPYFIQLLREGTATQDGSDSMTLRSGSIAPSRTGSSIAPQSSRGTMGSGLTLVTSMSSTSSNNPNAPSTAGTSVTGNGNFFTSAGGLDAANMNITPTPRSLAPGSRPRCLYLPHTYLTVQALLHYLYTSSLPAPTSPLCTPQILCSLLQISRPYRIDGLLEAVVERLHALLDSRNAAAVFNATAMAAGGGRGIDGSLNPNFFVPVDAPGMRTSLDQDEDVTGPGLSPTDISGLEEKAAALKINTSTPSQQSGGGATITTTTTNNNTGRPASGELSATGSASGSEWSSEFGDASDRGAGQSVREPWTGELSSVIGLQKRGLRGLMEGRRMRERTGTVSGSHSGGMQATMYGGGSSGRVGLGIAGP